MPHKTALEEHQIQHVQLDILDRYVKVVILKRIIQLQVILSVVHAGIKPSTPSRLLQSSFSL